MAKVFYITTGSIRGECGHEHRTRDTARRCVERDHRDCVRGNGQDAYTDRHIVKMVRE